MELSTLTYSDDDGWSQPLPAWDTDRTLVLAFCAPSFIDRPEALTAIRSAFPTSSLLGCSTAGEIHGAKVTDDTISLAVLRFERTALRTAEAKIDGTQDSYAAGVSIGRSLRGPGLRSVLVLSDGLGVNGTALARGINAELGDEVVVTGGLAGDGDRFKRTWVLAGGKPQSGYVSAVAFYGDAVSIGHGSKGGWDIFGVERVVTRSKANVLYELDDKPALELYKLYLGERALGLPATALLFPLSLRVGTDNDSRLVRTVLAVDEATQSMTFAGDIPQGASALLMHANFDRLVQGASDAATMAAQHRDADRPVAAIAVSCVGRRLVLGERVEEELEATMEILPPLARQIGFYSYGELSPYADGRCELHNQTMTLTTISEA